MAPLAGVGTLGEGGWWGSTDPSIQWRNCRNSPFWRKTLVSCKCSQTNKLKRVQTKSILVITPKNKPVLQKTSLFGSKKPWLSRCFFRSDQLCISIETPVWSLGSPAARRQRSWNASDMKSCSRKTYAMAARNIKSNRISVNQGHQLDEFSSRFVGRVTLK